MLLDSIIRNSGANTTGNGAVSEPISCAVDVNASLSLAGVRIGLPSTFAWQTPGISAEVGTLTCSTKSLWIQDELLS